MNRSAILSVRILGDAKSAVKAMGETSKQSGLMGKALRGVGKVGVAALTAVGAVAGTALVKGFQRLTSIENAQAKLKGLGNDAEDVEKIMGNALTAVKGTAFGLDEAATTAAGAVAAGIAPGAELERMLGSVANAAAAAGTPMAEMGSIFNKVATVDMAQMDVLNQVSDRGIPIMAALADTLGVTTGEVRKMASAGEIGFSEFETAMISASGTVAEEMGKTTTGSFANMMASLSRLGEALLKGIFPAFATTFTAAGGFIDGLTEKIGPVAEVIGQRLGDALAGIGPALSTIGDSLTPVLENLGSVASGVFDQIGPAAAIVVEAFAPLIPQVMELATQFSPLSIILQVVGQVLPQLVPGLAQAGAAVGTLLSAVVPLVSQLVGALVPILVQLFSGVLPPLLDAFNSVTSALMPLVEAIMGLLIPAFEFLLPIVVGIVEGIVGNIIGAVEGIVRVITGVVDFVTAIFTGDWAAAWNALGDIVMGAVQAVWNIINLWIVGRVLGVVRGALTSVRGIFTGAWNAIKGIVTTGVQAVRQVIATVLAGVKALISGNLATARALFSRAWNAITGAVSRAWTMIKTYVLRGMASMVQSVSSGIQNVGRFFRELPGKIGGWLGGLASRLLRIGQDMMRGLTRGIGNGIQWVKDKLLGGVRGVIDGAKKLLGIASPSKVFATMGGQIAQGMANGIASQEQRAVRAVDHMARSISRTGQSKLSGALDVDLGAPRLSLAAGSTANRSASAPVTINVTVQAGVGDPVEIGREVDRVLNRYRRTVGMVAPRG